MQHIRDLGLLTPERRARLDWLRTTHAERGCGSFGPCRCSCPDHPECRPDEAEQYACLTCHDFGLVPSGMTRGPDGRLTSRSALCPDCSAGCPKLSPTLPWHREGEYGWDKLPDVPEIREPARAWLDGRFIDHPWLTLSGKPGRGKTIASYTVAFALARAGHRVLATSAAQFLNGLKATFDAQRAPDGPSPTEEFRRHYASAEVLVLNDLGAEHMTDWSIPQIEDIIDRRYEARLLTVYTTNMGPRSPGRVWSRVFGELSLVAITMGADLRRQWQEEDPR